MERRRLGRTDMDVTVLGFGGAEIGFEGASAETVKRLLGGALDAGLNLIEPLHFIEEPLPPIDAIVSSAIAARPEVRIAEQTVRQMDQEQAARAQLAELGGSEETPLPFLRPKASARQA